MKFERDPKITDSISERLRTLLTASPMSLSQLSSELGYTKPSTLYAIRDGKVLPDIFRLYKLANQQFGGGKKPNLNWLVTGEGKMLIEPAAKADPLAERLSKILSCVPEEKMSAILTLLDKKGL